MFKALKWLVVTSLLVGGLGGGWLYHFADQPLAIPEKGVTYELKPGSNIRIVARQLTAAGVLAEPWSFMALVRLSGKAGQIQAGNYFLEPGTTALELYRKITEGDVTQQGVRFIEGWTFRQMRAALDANEHLTHETKGMTEEAVLARLGITDGRAEGLFYPDTYLFAEGTSDLLILQRAYDTMQRHLATEWEKRAQGLPYRTPYEALTMASIVEKETGQGSERPLIAAVFINRLHLGMRLQTDPTVIYGLGESFDGNLRKVDLLTDTPYNTYTRAGLPPTPIAMPSLAALQAALHPADSRALYFVAKGDGSHKFSDSLAEHNQAVNRYQRAPARRAE